MSQYYGDIGAGATLRFGFSTNATDGSAITYTVGTIGVYKDADAGESTAGVTVSVDHDGKTGTHLITIDTSADAAFYSTGSNFNVKLINATIDGVTGINAFVGAFSIANRPVQSLVAGVNTSIAAAVWDRLTSALTTSGSIGKWLLDHIAVIEAKTDTIGTEGALATSPVIAAHTVRIVYGDSYLVANGRQIDLVYSGFPSFTGGSQVTLKAVKRGDLTDTVVTWTGSVEASDTLRFTPDTADTSGSELASTRVTQTTFPMEVSLMLSNGKIITPTSLHVGVLKVDQQAS